MVHVLTDQVYFGDWQAPFECLSQVKTIINVAHDFSLRRGRRIYWQKLQELNHEVLYVRLARKDRVDVDEKYYQCFKSIVLAAEAMGKMPILTHCQLGGHRGPSAAIMAAFILSGEKREVFESVHKWALEFVPKLAPGNKYYQSTLRICAAHFTN